MFLLFILVLFKSAMAGSPTDLNCTEVPAAGGDAKYTEKAVNCNDKFPSAVCLVIYTAAVAAGTSTERNEKCFQGADKKRNEEVVQAAVQTCPKTCGYCCITPAYSCKNKAIPRVKCETVTKEQCADDAWKKILTEDCPAVCGFCEASADPSCKDKVESCKNDPSICRNVDMQDFVKANCQATCGFCGSTTGSPGGATTTASGGGGGTTVACGNLSSCSSWVSNGFCTSTFYTDQQKRQYCGRPCNLC